MYRHKNTMLINHDQSKEKALSVGHTYATAIINFNIEFVSEFQI